MATIKAYTDINQSRKLAEFLPLESADMYYWCADHYPKEDWIIEVGAPDDNYECICAWSLAALLGVLPNNKKETTTLSRGGWKIEPIEYIDKWFCEYEDEVNEDSPCKNFTVSADNPVDACYEMILKLNELKML